MTDPRIFVCSDWHLGHDNLVDLGHRPAKFSELLIDHVKSSGIGRGDVLLNLGDAHVGRDGSRMTTELLEWARDQGISTILVRGNHDSTKWVRSIRMGWSWACDSTSLAYNGKRLLFTHVPVETEFEEDFNVHGHLHQVEGHRGGLIRDGKHILISMELLRYRPIPLDVLVCLGCTPSYVLGKFVKEGAEIAEGNNQCSGDVEEPQEASGS